MGLKSIKIMLGYPYGNQAMFPPQGIYPPNWGKDGSLEMPQGIWNG